MHVEVTLDLLAMGTETGCHLGMYMCAFQPVLTQCYPYRGTGGGGMIFDPLRQGPGSRGDVPGFGPRGYYPPG